MRYLPRPFQDAKSFFDLGIGEEAPNLKPEWAAHRPDLAIEAGKQNDTENVNGTLALSVLREQQKAASDGLRR